MTRALITGITGMVGSHLCDYLVSETDWQVFGIVRWRSSLAFLEPHFPEIDRIGGRVQLLYGDLNDPISLGEAVEVAAPDYVFHLAAQSFPKTSFSAPLDTLGTNVIGTYAFLDAVLRKRPDAHVHVCSSSEVFGRVPRDEVPIKENANFHPASPYAISKTGTDLIGRFFYEAYGLQTQTTRMFTHTGPRRGDVFAESSFAKQIAMAEMGLTPNVVKVGNLKSLRTVADVRDAVRAYHMLLTVDPVPGAFYNIGGRHVATIQGILDYLLEISDLRGTRIVEDPERLRPIDADVQIPDTSKFENHTGWTPEVPFEQTMRDLLDYWRTRVSSEGLQISR